MVIEIAMAVLAVAAVVIVIRLLPLLSQLHATVKESEQLLRRLNTELPILLREATEAVQNINRATGDLRSMTAHVRDLGEAIEAIKRDVHHSIGAFENIIRRWYGAIRVGTDNTKNKVYRWLNDLRTVWYGFTHKPLLYRQPYNERSFNYESYEYEKETTR
jgi:uncharacterized protein YoxC